MRAKYIGGHATKPSSDLANHSWQARSVVVQDMRFKTTLIEPLLEVEASAPFAKQKESCPVIGRHGLGQVEHLPFGSTEEC